MNPYEDLFVRIDQMFNGDWRVQVLSKFTLAPMPLERPSRFKTRQAAWDAAQALGKWFSIDVEEAG